MPEAVAETMAELIREGKIRYWGISETMEENATMGQLSLAWMVNKKPYTVPIPGSRKPERLKENFEAGNLILTEEEIAMIDAKLDTMSFDIFGGHSSK